MEWYGWNGHEKSTFSDYVYSDRIKNKDKNNSNKFIL